MNRRTFFKALAAAAAVVALPTAWITRKYRKLHGDGVTDDTEALHALLQGEPVQMPNGVIQQVPEGGAVFLQAGTYRITDLLSLYGRQLTGVPGHTTLDMNPLR